MLRARKVLGLLLAVVLTVGLSMPASHAGILGGGSGSSGETSASNESTATDKSGVFWSIDLEKGYPVLVRTEMEHGKPLNRMLYDLDGLDRCPVSRTDYSYHEDGSSEAFQKRFFFDDGVCWAPERLTEYNSLGRETQVTTFSDYLLAQMEKELTEIKADGTYVYHQIGFSGTLECQYDKAGNLIRTKSDLDGPNFTEEYQYSYGSGSGGRKEVTSPDGFTMTIVEYGFDISKDAKETSYQKTDDEGNVVLQRTTTYTEEGADVQVVEFNANGGIEEASLLSYGNDGELHQAVFVDGQNEIVRELEVVYDEQLKLSAYRFHDQEGEANATFHFADNGDLEYVLYCDEELYLFVPADTVTSGLPDAEQVIAFDENGLLSELDGAIPEYDELGNIVKLVIPGINETWVSEYDEYCREVGRKVYNRIGVQTGSFVFAYDDERQTWHGWEYGANGALINEWGWYNEENVIPPEIGELETAEPETEAYEWTESYETAEPDDTGELTAILPEVVLKVASAISSRND